MPRHRKALPGASAIVLLAIVTAFALCGCSGSQAQPARSPSVGSVTETGTPFQSDGPIAARPWYEDLPSIPLDTALSEVGVAVSLPDTAVVGTPTHVSVTPGTRSLDATPSFLVLYSSGVQLLVNDLAPDLQKAADSPVEFTDGRKTMGEVRQVDGVPVLVTQPGIQSGSHSSGHRVAAQLIWNAGGLNYYMISSTENQSTDHLIVIMRTMRPAMK